jgi:acetoin utilization deacetylase AcuC-like enzyme
MQKYRLLREMLLAEGILTPDELRLPPPASEEQVLRVHTQEYYKKLTQGELSSSEIRRLGFPWSLELLERSLHSSGGTVAASRSALKNGISANLAGGTHHAHPGHGEGFCLLNDTAIAARAVLSETRVLKVLVLDCDVHQGNGTAAVFRDDPHVFTFSIHAEKNFPFRKTAGDLDIALPDGVGDDKYIDSLSQAIQKVFNNFSPQLVIYIAGADPHRDDRLGRLSLSMDGLERRDRLVIDRCLAEEIPLAVVLGGGYGRDIMKTVEIHIRTIKNCKSHDKEFHSIVRKGIGNGC